MRYLHHLQAIKSAIWGCKNFVVGACIGCLVTFLLYDFPPSLFWGEQKIDDATKSDFLDDIDEKGILHYNAAQRESPVMYTFYQNSSSVGDTALLKVWESKWQSAGWETVILKMEDAEAHPEFFALNSLIEPLRLRFPDSARIYRWAAMAVAVPFSGGWMSDLDVLPLHIRPEDGFEMPNGGSFTFHNEMEIPDLMSGSGREWDRMLKEVIDIWPEDTARTKSENSLLSALFRIRGENIAMVKGKSKEVSPGFQFITVNAVDCSQYMMDTKAISFSPTALNDGFLGGWLETLIRDMHEGEIEVNFTNEMEERIRINPDTRLYTHVGSNVGDIEVEVNRTSIGKVHELYEKYTSHLAGLFMNRTRHQCAVL